MMSDSPMTEVWTLAGGGSSRMGTCKANLEHEGLSLLEWSTLGARSLGFPIRINDKDMVPGLGPLGGLWTLLQTTQASQVLCLSCDMPLIGPAHLKALIAKDPSGNKAVFTRTSHGDGFPFLFPVALASTVRSMLDTGRRSLQALSIAVGGLGVAPDPPEIAMNINTREEWDKWCLYLKANPLVRNALRG